MHVHVGSSARKKARETRFFSFRILIGHNESCWCDYCITLSGEVQGQLKMNDTTQVVSDDPRFWTEEEVRTNDDVLV